MRRSKLGDGIPQNPPGPLWEFRLQPYASHGKSRPEASYYLAVGYFAMSKGLINERVQILEPNVKTVVNRSLQPTRLMSFEARPIHVSIPNALVSRRRMSRVNDDAGPDWKIRPNCRTHPTKIGEITCISIQEHAQSASIMAN